MQWDHSVVQNTSSTTIDAGSTPYSFGAFINGTTGDPLTVVTFTSATAGLTNGSPGPSLSFDVNDEEWRYESTPFDTLANMTMAIPTNGTNPYTLSLVNTGGGSINGVAFPTVVTFPVLPGIEASGLSTVNVATPLLGLTNGSWQPNGTFLVSDVNAPITISFNDVFNTAPSGTDAYHFDAAMWTTSGMGGDVTLTGGVTDGFVNYDPTTGNSPAAPLSISDLTIASGQLVDGNTYDLEVGYEMILNADGTVLGGTAFAVGLYGIRTTIIIVTPLAAVPEPSTYAAILGALAFGGVVWMRRRRI